MTIFLIISSQAKNAEKPLWPNRSGARRPVQKTVCFPFPAVRFSPAPPAPKRRRPASPARPATEGRQRLIPCYRGHPETPDYIDAAPTATGSVGGNQADTVFFFGKKRRIATSRLQVDIKQSYRTHAARQSLQPDGAGTGKNVQHITGGPIAGQFGGKNVKHGLAGTVGRWPHTFIFRRIQFLPRYAPPIILIAEICSPAVL